MARTSSSASSDPASRRASVEQSFAAIHASLTPAQQLLLDEPAGLLPIEIADFRHQVVASHEAIAPQDALEVLQVITCADFHPQHCNIFGYSTSKGCIRLADMRAAALCDQHAKIFEDSGPAVRVQRFCDREPYPGASAAYAGS